jgi:predicted ester cyclase
MKQTLLLCALTVLLALSCKNAGMSSAGSENTEATSAAERNKKVVQASMEAINRHDVEAVVKDAAPELVDLGDGTTGGIKLDSLKKIMAQWFAAFPDYKVENLDYVAEGDKVMVSSDASGTWKGAFMGMQPTGKSFHTKDVDIFTFNNKGQVVTHRTIQNMNALLATLGAPIPLTAGDEQKQMTADKH